MSTDPIGFVINKVEDPIYPPISDKKVYFTVDLDQTHIEEMCHYLKKHNLPAMLFINGSVLSSNSKYGEAIKDYISSVPGSDTAIHTYTHKSMANMTNKEIKQEIDLTENVMINSGIMNKKYIRLPYMDGGSGDNAIRIQSLLKELGYTPHPILNPILKMPIIDVKGYCLNDHVYWDLPTQEYDNYLNTTVPTLPNPLVMGCHSGSNILQTILWFQKNGWKFQYMKN